MDNKNTRLFILSKSGIYVDGIQRILTNDGGYKVVVCAEPGKSCWEKFCAAEPHVALINYDAIKLCPEDILLRLLGHIPSLCILVFGRDLDRSQVLELVHSGVLGYLPEEAGSEELLEAIKNIRAGLYWLSRGILCDIVKRAVKVDQVIEETITRKLDTLSKEFTVRETDILQRVLEGLTTKEIANDLHLSEQGVKLHLGSLFKKLDVSSRTQMVLAVLIKVCPVSNMIRLFRIAFDKRRLALGKKPIIEDPLQDLPVESKII